MDHFKNNSLKLENNIDFRRNIDSKKRNFVHPPTRPKNAMNATRNFENQPNHYTFPQKRYLHQNQINHNDFIKKARPNLFLRSKPIPRINANFGQLQNRPHLKPPANPLTLYGVFKGYIFGQISDFGKVSVGTKVVLIKDINNKIDPLSIKVCPQQNFSGENVMGYCDVNTRDALTEILKNANFFKAEGIVCDFDEEIEDPPENQFAAQMKVYLIGPIFSIKKICSYLNQFF
ncbi:hypothetical protein MHBO_003494 [Bonamia ostreae]|uniref:Uncharacterized protein n=1 Tax=Bonamia ostreae TaxID=126728 RepID=A0ABV2AQZ9_9EUKA